MLESVDDRKNWGRYTFLGYEPTLEFTCMNHHLKIKSGMTVEKDTDNPADDLREILKGYRSPKIDGMPTFTGGMVGYFSYDYIKYAEPELKLDAKDEEGFKDVDLMLLIR